MAEIMNNYEYIGRVINDFLLNYEDGKVDIERTDYIIERPKIRIVCYPLKASHEIQDVFEFNLILKDE